jgi:hypothetical protein
VTVTKVSISGAGFNVSGIPAGLILAPGQDAALAVTFAPSSVGSVTGKVSVITGPWIPALAIPLSGEGVTPSGHTVRLTWDPSTSGVIGYRAYRATSAAGPFTALHSAPNPQTRYTDSTVQSGTTYYYVVTAVASGDAESAYSNQASATIPNS